MASIFFTKSSPHRRLIGPMAVGSMACTRRWRTSNARLIHTELTVALDAVPSCTVSRKSGVILMNPLRAALGSLHQDPDSDCTGANRKADTPGADVWKAETPGCWYEGPATEGGASCGGGGFDVVVVEPEPRTDHAAAGLQEESHEGS